MAFAGGRLRVDASTLGATYSVSMWVWNGMPRNGRPVTGYLFSRGKDGLKEVPGDHLGIGGTHSHSGKLFLFNGNKRDELLGGKTVLPLRTWSHVVLVREQEMATIYLNGVQEVTAELTATHGNTPDAFLGGRSDNFANLEGRLDEVAIFSRALSAAEVAEQFAASGIRPADPPPN
jgi:hypothetical protein